MDLNSACNLGGGYRDYQDVETKAKDYNQRLTSHVFDIGPLTTQYNGFTQRPPQAYNQATTYQQVAPAVRLSDHHEKPMSSEYLHMKQAQEYQTLSENPMVNRISMSQLQQQQGDETRRLSEQMQRIHADKYSRLKYMSPETLNQIYQRPVCQSVQPQTEQTQINDVFSQTCYHGSSQNVPTRQIKQQVEQRQHQILTDKQKTGVQSYVPDGSFCGVDINLAYRGNSL
jgi:hypothetical protein